jgi:hypothetical protein
VFRRPVVASKTVMGDLYALLIAAGCFAVMLALLWSLEKV